MQSVWLIAQLLFCLAFGFLAAKHIPHTIEKFAFKILPYFSYLLLFSIAFEFAQVLDTITHPSKIITNALILSITTTLGSFFCCYFLLKRVGIQATQGKVSTDLFFKSLVHIAYASFILILGYCSALMTQHFNVNMHLNSWYLLLLFMLLIGLDLAHSPIDRSWINWKILIVPSGAIIGSILGAMISYVLVHDINLKDLFMLSQGYGFYSMTGIVVTELKNPELGSIALMNDLFREIFAILLMYLIGWRQPRSAIAAAGATSMDATLPMVKQACGNAFIPHAMVSGFILSILAPIAVSVLAAI